MGGKKTVGVLALQGDFEAHQRAIESAGGRAVEVRTAAEMNACDGLIVPGGESTTMLKLLEIENLTESIRAFAASKPVFGTCAGAILLRIPSPIPRSRALTFSTSTSRRNAYGRQVDSRIQKLETGEGTLEAVFIRAPIIRRVGTEARVLAALRQGSCLGRTRPPYGDHFSPRTLGLTPGPPAFPGKVIGQTRPRLSDESYVTHMVEAAISLNSILRAHRDWVENPAQGQRADLSGLTLNEVKLSGENLQKALMVAVTMLDADLTGADLTGANLDRGGPATLEPRRREPDRHGPHFRTLCRGLDGGSPAFRSQGHLHVVPARGHEERHLSGLRGARREFSRSQPGRRPACISRVSTKSTSPTRTSRGPSFYHAPPTAHAVQWSDISRGELHGK
ncbi:MAG: pyridoxal 5'-phosphate synthase glutaminase subunit PdxT [Acidobacteriota bacterium]